MPWKLLFGRPATAIRVEETYDNPDQADEPKKKKKNAFLFIAFARQIFFDFNFKRNVSIERTLPLGED